MTVPTLASRIRAIRTAHKLSQEAVAARAGMKQTRISAIERGVYTNLRIDTLRKLAAGLGCAVGELIDD